MSEESHIGFNPYQFIGIPYSAYRYPGKIPIEKFREGCNCQLFTLGVLLEAGFELDSTLRSQELWEDQALTCWVGTDPLLFKLFDILFFLPRSAKTFESRRLHLGVFIGRTSGGKSLSCLHNAKPGPSAIWALEDFTDRYELFGGKRPLMNKD